MNVMLKVQRSPGAFEIAHSVMAYDRPTDVLELELPIPLFLDTLALKVARVPPQDKYGVLSYVLEPRAVDTFRFLLGIDVNLSKREYFLEPTAGFVENSEQQKVMAVELLTELTPRPRYTRTEAPRISERELVLPTLLTLERDGKGWMATRDLIVRLSKIFAPSGQDALILKDRRDTYFSQKVRNIISHRNQPSSFIQRGLADYELHGLRITDHGRSIVHALLS